MKYLSIGAMAKANSVSVKALRVYQDKGILQPQIVDENTGYRYYSILQSGRLDMITQLRSIGLSLDQIAGIAEKKSIRNLREQALGRRDEIDAEIARLQSQRLTADHLIADCDAYLNKALCDRPILEMIPERKIILFEAPTLADLGGDEPYTDFERWCWYHRYVKRLIQERGYPLSLYRNVGNFVPQSAFGTQRGTLFTQPFVFIDESLGEQYQEAVTLPAGQHMVVYYSTCHSEDDGADFDNERIPKLLAALDNQDLEPCGPLTIEGISMYKLFFETDAQAYFRHCVPVRPKGKGDDRR